LLVRQTADAQFGSAADEPDIRVKGVWSRVEKKSAGRENFGNQNFPKWEGKQQLAISV
jgi:hypothetical protein